MNSLQLKNEVFSSKLLYLNPRFDGEEMKTNAMCQGLHERVEGKVENSGEDLEG